MRLFRLLCLLGLIGLSACRSSSNSSDVAINLEGVWRGDCGGNCGTLTGVVTPDGFGAFYDRLGLTYFVTGLNHTNLAENGTVYAPFDGTLDSANERHVPLHLDGIASQSSIAGSIGFSITGSMPKGPPVDVTLNVNLSPYADLPSSTLVPGTWQGYEVASSKPIPITLDIVTSSDSFSGTDGNLCTQSGSIYLATANPDLFTVAYTTGGPTATCGESFAGYAYQSRNDDFDYFSHAAGTYLYVIASGNAGDAMVIELKSQ